MHNRLFEKSDGQKGESSLFIPINTPTKCEDIPLLRAKVENSLDGCGY